MGDDSPKPASAPTGAVFLSYASQDAEAARRICEGLRSAAVEVWFDQSELRGGDAWDRKIRKQIHDCALFVPVISGHSDARDEGYFRREWKLAVDRTADMAEDVAFLLPVVIDGTPDGTARVPDRFREVHWSRLPHGHTPPAFVEQVVRLLSPSAPGKPETVRRKRGDAAAATSAPGLDRSRYKLSRRRVLVGLASLAAVALAVYLTSPWLRSNSTAVPPMRSVALLAVQNLTGDRSLDTAADKLTEDAMYVLGRSGQIRVATRNAVFALKGKPVDERRLGKELNVRHVVIASLRRSESLYRVSFQIVDTSSGQVVGSQDIGAAAAPDGSLPEHRLAMKMFAEIAGVIRERFQDAELAKPPDDADPENLIARLTKLDQDNRRADIPQAEHVIAAARSVTTTNPDFRWELFSGACEYYSDLIDAGYYSSPEQRTAWAQNALDFGRQAMEIAPNRTAPHVCRATVFTQLERWDEGTAEARYVIETFPLTSNGYEALANLELARGRFNDALKDFAELAERAGGHTAELGLVHLFLGENEAAIAELRKQAVVAPKDPWAPFFLSAALELAGKHGEAASMAELYGKLKSDDRIWRTLELSHEPAFIAAASATRKALHDAGLDEPPSRH
jgi:TolB-like protein/tetratricopeptide (TPR) repeat protein